MLSSPQKYIRHNLILGIISALICLIFAWYISPLLNNPYLFKLLYHRSFVLSATIAILPMMILIIRLAELRFFTSGIDGSSTPDIDIDVKVLNNTHEQTLIFLVVTLFLNASISPLYVTLLPILAIFFFIARMLFWYGYLRNPIARAYGFAMTFYLNVFIFVLATIKFFLN